MLKLIKPSKNPEVKQLWKMRNSLRDAIDSVNETELEEVEGAMAVSFDESPSLVEGAEANYEHWKATSTESFIQVLANREGSLPDSYKKRLRESWFELFRLAFLEELKTNERAGMAYLLSSFERIGLAIGKTQREVESGFEKVSEHFERVDKNLQGVLSVLEEVRKLVKNHNEGAISQQSFDKAIEGLGERYETCMDNLSNLVSAEHRRTRKESRKEHRKTHSGIERLEKAMHELIPKEEQPLPLKELLIESNEQLKLGNYQKAAERAEDTVEECVVSEKPRALFNAADRWCHVLQRRGCEPGTSPEFALAKFKKYLEASIEAGLDIERVRHLEMKMAQVAGTPEEIISAASKAIEAAEDDHYISDARFVKAQALSSQGNLEEALSEIDHAAGIESLEDDQEAQLKFQSARLWILADHTATKQEDIDSFTALVLACTEDAHETNQRVNEIHGRLVRKSNELQEKKTVSRAENLEEGSFLAPQNPGEEFDDKEVSNYMQWAIQVLESGYELILKTDVDAKSLAEHAFRIGERYAVLGNVDTTFTYLAHGERWITNLKDKLNEDSEFPWPHLRSWGLANRGRTLFRLCRSVRGAPDREKWILDAKEAVITAQEIVRNNESQFRGNSDLFSSEMEYWIGECRDLLGDHVEAAKNFAKAQSTIGMATEGYARDVGYPTKLREAEAWLCAHEDDKAKNILVELVQDDRAPERVRAVAREKLAFLENAPAGPYIDEQGILRFGPGGVQGFAIKDDDD